MLKAWAGAFSVGSVAQYVAAITALSENINQLMTTWGELRTNAVILRETFAFFDTPNPMYQGSLTTEKTIGPAVRDRVPGRVLPLPPAQTPGPCAT